MVLHTFVWTLLSLVRTAPTDFEKVRLHSGPTAHSRASMHRQLPFPSVHGKTLALLAASLFVLCTSRAFAQIDDGHGSSEQMKAAKVIADPYTKGGDEKLMEKAGIVKYAPLTWVVEHDTRKIRKVNSRIPIRFVETKHFKIGSTLPPMRLPKDKKAKKRLMAELKELKKTKFPLLRPRKVKVVDQWLRLHLFAHRLEKLYADLQTVLGVADADFPKLKSKKDKLKAKQQEKEATDASTSKADYMGEGPYLGMKSKFLVLLLQKEATLERYARMANQPMKKGFAPVFAFPRTGALFLGMHTELPQGYIDHELHTLMVFSATGMLLDGYKGFAYRLPAWLREGMSNWMARQLDPDVRFFSTIKDHDRKIRDDTFWPGIMRLLVKNDDFQKARKFLTYQHPKFDLFDHVAAWSRVDFLMQEKKRFAHFFSLVKTRLPSKVGQVPAWETVIANQKAALKAAYGYDAAGFDAAWTAYVQKTYPKKRKRRR